MVGSYGDCSPLQRVCDRLGLLSHCGQPFRGAVQ